MSNKEDLNAMEMLAAARAANDFKDVIVNLYGVDGNALSIVAAVTLPLRRAGAPKEVVDLFVNEALSGDYDNVLRTAQDWVTLVNIAPRSGAQSAVSAFERIGLDVEG